MEACSFWPRFRCSCPTGLFGRPPLCAAHQRLPKLWSALLRCSARSNGSRKRHDMSRRMLTASSIQKQPGDRPHDWAQQRWQMTYQMKPSSVQRAAAPCYAKAQGRLAMSGARGDSSTACMASPCSLVDAAATAESQQRRAFLRNVSCTGRWHPKLRNTRCLADGSRHVQASKAFQVRKARVQSRHWSQR